MNMNLKINRRVWGGINDIFGQGTFEGTLTGFSTGSPPASYANTTVADAYQGSKVLRVTNTLNGDILAAAVWSGLTVGEDYRVRGKARGDGTCRPALGRQGSAIGYWTGATTTDWQNIDVTITNSLNTTLWFTCHLSGDGSNYCEFDIITIEKTS